MINRHSLVTRLVFGAALVSLLASTGLLATPGHALQSANPVPTLVPPTLVPPPDGGVGDTLPSESAVARIRRDSKVRVGVLYNEPPFGEFSVRGEVSGFDAALARSMAEAWGVEIELVQVTRQTAIDMLVNGAVDMLVAAQVHRRELDARVEFSETYYPNSQSILVRDGDGATALGHFENRKVGVIMGSRGEEAAAWWIARTGLNVTVERFVNFDQAVTALFTQNIDGVVESRTRLTRLIAQQPGTARLVDDPVLNEPYAIVVRRQDVNMRNLVNRTLQYLVREGKVNDIHKEYFNGVNYPLRDFPVWQNLGDDAPKPDQVGTEMAFPAQYIVPRLQGGGALRVAGVIDVPEDAPESQKRLDAYNRAVIKTLAERWNVGIEYVPNSADNALDLVAGGQADIAVGAQADWAWADRVDFTSPYLLHGNRLMVKANSDVSRFSDLRSDWIGYFISEPGVTDIIRQLAEETRTRVDVYGIHNEEDAVIGMLVDNNYDAVFADSLKLIAHIEAYPDDVKLTTDADGNPRWYGRIFTTFAVPRNDIDFRLLVEYTLQDLSSDGTLLSLSRPVMLPGEMTPLEVLPGTSATLRVPLR